MPFMKKLLLIVIALTQILTTQGQSFHDFGFKRSTGISVVHNGTDTLDLPWVGGLNSVHFNQIDLNFDGVKDLVVFDKHGERLLTFLNNGQPGVEGWVYAPEYEKAFPKIYSWLQLRDYDCDGKEDIFAYGFGGIRVYRNTGDSVNGLSFQLKTYLLNSLQNGMLINILVTDMDYPAIDDIDGDGDLDLLCFFGLGAYVEYHKNYSKETQGNCELLDFRLEENCWGYFAESAFSNSLVLNLPCPWKSEPDPLKQIKHTGSTMQLIDLDSNGLMDLLLGDTDYLNIKSLINGGTVDSAHIVSQDTLFPSYNTPVDVASIPVASYFDADNDGHKDLVFAPFESRLNIPSNWENIWFYKNSGNSPNLVFNKVSTSFMQDRMVDVGAGAHPAIVDYNGDSLLDIIVGNYGYLDTFWYSFGNLECQFNATLALYKNTGTASDPVFTLIDRDFCNLSQYGYTFIRPTFADLDNDGDLDMIIGDQLGKIHRFTNTAGAGNPMSLTLAQSDILATNVGLYASPQLIDLDRDGKHDLVFGTRNTIWYDQFGNLLGKKSTLQYWRNTGSLSSPAFTRMSDSLGGVDATDTLWNTQFGYAVPAFFDDSLGQRHLYLGSVNGNIYHYKNIDNNLGGTFTRTDTVFFMVNDSVPEKVWVGIHASPALADLNSDGYIDLVIGNFSGGLNLFMGTTAPPIGVSVEDPEPKPLEVRIYPNPASHWVRLEIETGEHASHSRVLLIDLSGRTLREFQITEAATDINLEGLSSGVYLVRVISGEGAQARSRTLKLVLRH
jgi:hypothetical protein